MIYLHNIVCGFSFFRKLISLHGYVRFAREYNIFSYVIRPVPMPPSAVFAFTSAGLLGPAPQRAVNVLRARKHVYSCTYICIYTRVQTLVLPYGAKAITMNNGGKRKFGKRAKFAGARGQRSKLMVLHVEQLT